MLQTKILKEITKQQHQWEAQEQKEQDLPQLQDKTPAPVSTAVSEAISLMKAQFESIKNNTDKESMSKKEKIDIVLTTLYPLLEKIELSDFKAFYNCASSLCKKHDINIWHDFIIKQEWEGGQEINLGGITIRTGNSKLISYTIIEKLSSYMKHDIVEYLMDLVTLEKGYDYWWVFYCFCRDRQVSLVSKILGNVVFRN